uniref:PH domain-containing protein n=1 Tax=Mastacembelus armatus TaxID=205130 RepID=A0A7N8WPQ4_9TELE
MDYSHLLVTCSSVFLLVAAGGFMFKQWKEKYLVLTMEGNLLVCRDAESPPDQVVTLQTSCELIVEGREILDLPRLPPGGRRDCCFALILPQNKFLLLLTDNPDDCRWISDTMNSP